MDLSQISCPTCQNYGLVEIGGIETKSSVDLLVPGAHQKEKCIGWCDNCQRRWVITSVIDVGVFTEEYTPIQIDDQLPEKGKRANDKAEKILKDTYWEIRLDKKRQPLGWWHPLVSVKNNRLYPTSVALKLQKAFSAFDKM